MFGLDAIFDRVGSAFDNFTTGGTWGAIIGFIIGAIIGWFSPAAVPGNEIHAAFAGGVMGSVGGALTFAGVGAASGLLFGSGDKPGEPQAPSPEQKVETQVAQEQETPSPGKIPNNKAQEVGRG